MYEKISGFLDRGNGFHQQGVHQQRGRTPLQQTRARFLNLGLVCALLVLLVACRPSPEANVVGYLIAQRTGRLTASYTGPGGALQGVVQADGQPVAGATVLVAERNGQTHVAQSGADGRYQIREIPPGHYVPAAVAPGYTETQLQDQGGAPVLITVTANVTATAPALHLAPYTPDPLPTRLAPAVDLAVTARYAATTTFPLTATATVTAYRFTYAGATVDTLRLYLPAATDAPATLPLLYMVYPTAVDLWQSISVGYAVEGYAVLAISPLATRGLDIDGHAADARVGLQLAQSGALSPRIQPGPTIALGGSFSSAVLHRLLRGNDPATADAIIGWVTVGGITDAFSGTAAFYRGELMIPPEYTYLIPALGAPNLYPLDFLRYSPVYTAAGLPPTLIIHTAADRIIPIAQAYQLEAALRAAGVPTEVFYYEDVSHYLQIDDQMTDAGREMFYRVLDFADRLLKE
jgi:acetyl esterase/lipase